MGLSGRIGDTLTRGAMRRRAKPELRATVTFPVAPPLQDDGPTSSPALRSGAAPLERVEEERRRPATARWEQRRDEWWAEPGLECPWTFGEVSAVLPEFEDLEPGRMEPLLFREVIELSEAAAWDAHFVTWTNNAFRLELLDMHAMLRTMMQRQLTWHDFDSWVAWWAVFEGVLRDFMKHEELCFYPWIGPRNLPPGPLSNVDRSRAKLKIAAILDAVDKLLAHFGVMPVERAVTQLLVLVNDLTCRLLTYFEQKERTLPKLVSLLKSDAECKQLNRDFIQRLLVGEYGQDAVSLLTRSFGKDEQRQFKKDFLKPMGPFNVADYTDWVASFEKNHLARVAMEPEDIAPSARNPRRVDLLPGSKTFMRTLQRVTSWRNNAEAIAENT